MTHNTSEIVNVYFGRARLLPSLLLTLCVLCFWSTDGPAKPKPTQIPGTGVYVEWVSPTHVKIIDPKKLKLPESAPVDSVEGSTSTVSYEVLHPYGDTVPSGQQVATTVVSPIYPERAKLYYTQSDVQVRVLVGNTGVVLEAMATSDSDTDVGFERAALEAAMLYVYSRSPAGEKSWYTYTVEFRVDAPITGSRGHRYSATPRDVVWISPTDSHRLEPDHSDHSRAAKDSVQIADDATPVIVDIPQEEYSPAPDEFVAVQEMPTLIKEEEPVYPEIAFLTNREATVWVKALVDKEGKVREARIAKSSGMDVGFEEAALEAAYRAIYKPAIQNGRPVAIWLTYPIEFKLKKQ